MKVFLTGGTGFVGLALAARWAEDGAEVISTAEAPPPEWARKALPSVKFEVVDIRDAAALTRAVTEAAPDIMVQGAALTPDETRERAGGTAAIFEVNVAGTANALEAAAKAGVKRVVAFSSGAAYGSDVGSLPELDEITTPCQPTTLYAVSKLAAEKVALRLGALHGISVVTPRLSAAWGPWEFRTSMRQTLSPGYQIVEAVVAGTPPRVPPGATMPLVFSDDAATMITGLAVSDAVGPVNVGTSDLTDLGALCDMAVEMGRARGYSVDGPGRDVTIFAPDRPPIALNRLASAIGTWPKTGAAEALERCFDWYAGLAEPRPF